MSDGTNTDSADLVITLQNVIEMTSLTGLSTVNYEENRAVRVATYSASSEDDAHALRWSLSGDDANNFRIDEPGGALRFDIDPVSPDLFAQQPDYEDPDDDDEDGTYKATVQVRHGNDSHTLDVEVTITDQNEAGVLTLSTTRPEQGEAVTASLTDEDGVVGTPTYTWERSDGRSDWVTISGATAANYTPTAGETGHFLRVTVSYEDGHGTGQSATASSKEVVVGKLLHSLAVTTDDSPPRCDLAAVQASLRFRHAALLRRMQQFRHDVVDARGGGRRRAHSGERGADRKPRRGNCHDRFAVG